MRREAVQAIADRLRQHLTQRPLFRAAQLLGGQTVRDEEVGYNDFGSKLSLDYRTVFNPESRRDRANIVRNAYVKSQRREHYVDEIDRIIKSSVISIVPGAKLIEDTSNPAELITTLRAGKTLENEIMLLVGGRGSGKTTFVDYCGEVKLPKDLLETTIWIHLNLHESPTDKTLLEQWLLTELIDGLQLEYPQIDFDHRDTLDDIFGPELKKLRNGPLARLDPSSESYILRIADALIELQKNKVDHLRALCRYLVGDRQRLLIVVFDNCDKRNRDEQLQTFQSARWLQSLFRCLVILPISDITYETYKDAPPLDTTIKDLVFRIEPPPFSKVLSNRIKLVLSDLNSKSGTNLLDYTLKNGIRVEYSASEIGYYLSTIYKS